MVPRIAKIGTSFKGAGLYYLHDKRIDDGPHPTTSHRVVFTQTRNMLTVDPEFALRLMAKTAMDEKRLKKEAGLSLRGRKTTKPVYSYSLSWHTEQQPTRGQMIKAADISLALLGMAHHEAVFIAHKDTKHPHIHVIVNRIDPYTGKAANNYRDRLTLSSWAQDYELDDGKIYCQQRVINNERRYQINPQTGRHNYVIDNESTRRREQQAWAKEQRKLLRERHASEKMALEHLHADERLWLDQKRDAAIFAARTIVRQEMRPLWHALLIRQQEEKARRSHITTDLKALYERLRVAPKGVVTMKVRSMAAKRLADWAGLQSSLEVRHTTERLELREQHWNLIRIECERVENHHRQRMAQLIARQTVQKADQKDRFGLEKKRLAADRKAYRAANDTSGKLVDVLNAAARFELSPVGGGGGDANRQEVQRLGPAHKVY